MDHIKEFTPWAAIAISFFTLLWQLVKEKRTNWKEFVNKQDDRYAKLTDRMTEVEVKMELFWDSTKEAMRNLIKQPIHFRKDELVDKFIDERIRLKSDEILELKSILLEEQQVLLETKNTKALYYSLLLWGINQELHDRGCLCKDNGRTQ